MSGDMLTPDEFTAWLYREGPLAKAELLLYDQAQRERIADLERQLAHWKVRSGAQGREVERLEREVGSLRQMLLDGERERSEARAALETQAEWAANKIAEIVEEKVALQSALEEERSHRLDDNEALQEAEIALERTEAMVAVLADHISRAWDAIDSSSEIEALYSSTYGLLEEANNTLANLPASASALLKRVEAADRLAGYLQEVYGLLTEGEKRLLDAYRSAGAGEEGRNG
jgi:chromosome segregation ATPase